MKQKTYNLVLLLGTTVIALQLLWLLTKSDLVGHDFEHFLPRLLAGVRFFKAQGWDIPYYSPLFCGAKPFFANPQSMFYSVPQMLTMVIDPWSATLFTSLFFLFIGSIGTALFMNTILRLPQIYSLLAAFSFALNGFYRSHILAGHLNFHSFMLLPLICFLLLYKQTTLLRAGIVSGILCAYIVHSGGHYLAIIIPLSVILTLLLCCSIKQPAIANCRELLSRLLLCSTIGLGLSLNKIIASIDYLHFNPRIIEHEETVTLWNIGKLIVSQLHAPSLYTPYLQAGIWEYDCTITILMSIGVLYTLIHWKSFLPNCRLLPLCFFAIISVLISLFIAQNSLGKTLHLLPLVNMTTAPTRFSSCFIFPIILIGTIGLNKMKIIRNKRIASVLILILVIPPFSALYNEQAYNHFNIKNISERYSSIWESDSEAQVEYIEPRTPDIEAVTRNVSTYNCTEALFGYKREITLSARLKIDNTSKEHYELENPACYIYPRENNCEKGEKISKNDIKNFTLLTKHKNPKWKISHKQEIANIVTRIFLIVILLLIGIFIGKEITTKIRISS